MAETRRFSLTPQLDMEQILLEAQHRWLRPAEICEILRNHQNFRIAPEPPNKPSSGSLFLFDRKVLRYFRKDGHNWRKKKDGKTVREAHERLKAGSIDVLHCYYAHGEENENFQRRSYWMLEEDLMHIVLVHYLEVKGHKPNFSRSRDSEETPPVKPIDSPVRSNSIISYSQMPSQATDAESHNSALTSEYEDTESDNYQTSSRYHTFTEMQQYGAGQLMSAQCLDPCVPDPSMDSHSSFQVIDNKQCHSVQENMLDEIDLRLAFKGSKLQLDPTSWDEVLGHSARTLEMPSFQSSLRFTEPVMGESDSRVELSTYGNPYAENLSNNQDVSALLGKAWQLSTVDSDSAVIPNINVDNETSVDGNADGTPLLKQISLDFSSLEGEGLKKYDSFSKWMSKELGEVDESHTKSNSGAYWSAVGSDNVAEDSSISNHEHLDAYIMPSLSQDQLFSIIDFSPNWAYAGSQTKVLITGTFLKNKDFGKCKWSCMFGEVEVSAEVVGDGILRCHAPPYKSGRVPFYITCSNRLACSEVREFEFRDCDSSCVENMNSGSNKSTEINLLIRLDKLLTLGPLDCQKDAEILAEKVELRSKISAMMEGVDEWSTLLKMSKEKSFSVDNAKDQLLEALLREKLHAWLLHKVSEDIKGPNVWDEEGQGVLHLAAALGYDWAIKPTVTAGVNINFRDTHGWTALHWAASCGRERTICALVAMGAGPGLLTDPTPEFPSGRTPADLASANGHKGIAGFLAESSLTSHLSVLTIDPKASDSDFTSFIGDEDVSQPNAPEVVDGDTQAELSLKDSLSAVRNASQAAARIYQVFRMHSFHRNKFAEYEDDNTEISEEHAISLLTVKSQNSGLYEHDAAIRIQNKFRGWKRRKEFLITRQRIVKIQAHVRGHQVRKRYKKIVWTVGILEKVILRWRRKGSGLRGFRSEAALEGTSMQCQPAKEDEYDFLHVGRKQTEARLEKALARVKSMVQYPEARDQYRRLLNVVSEIQESKATQEHSLNESEDAADCDVMVDLDELCEDEAMIGA
ncbi:calmodulin-binding transcription activator 3-like isoform X2 [Zingiber officinale]|uniref:calmodulin-binding transcription activator 3-like isoform X2 n=1 Tax=Zingiber officinale TaxID=94328 RepID=UPI001C4CF15C|nr:calmodulin-binding transcription activator 3-like isoform X2 [Zingiber officinale]